MRASDLIEYLKTHIATPEMRKVQFNLADRLVLIPVEDGLDLKQLRDAAKVTEFLLNNLNT